MNNADKKNSVAPEHQDAERFSNSLERKFEQVVTPFQDFIRDATTASVLLLICTVAAFIIAHSPWNHEYQHLLHTSFGFVIGDHIFDKSLLHWINDALMALFFFVIGLEIKRELLAGELQQLRRSVPVIAAALGGMVAPALIYAAFNHGTAATQGWGIPLATDTAFAVGVVVLLGRRVPASLAAFITAIAIIDDIGAVLVIALFYTDVINFIPLLLALLLLAVLLLFNLLGVRRPAAYLLVGGLVWLAMLGSGVHATVAGILVAFTVPARPRRGPFWFLRHARRLINEFEKLELKKRRHGANDSILATDDQHLVVEKVEAVAHEATTPLQLWERSLETPVALLVLPVFALANAAVPVSFTALPEVLSDPVALGILLGLVLGKATGVSGMCWLALKSGWGELPPAMRFSHVVGIALLGGMGFTMSIFISALSFDDERLLVAKSAVLIATLIAGVSGYLWLRLTSTKKGAS